MTIITMNQASVTLTGAQFEKIGEIVATPAGHLGVVIEETNLGEGIYAVTALPRKDLYIVTPNGDKHQLSASARAVPRQTGSARTRTKTEKSYKAR